MHAELFWHQWYLWDIVGPDWDINIFYHHIKIDIIIAAALQQRMTYCQALFTISSAEVAAVRESRNVGHSRYSPFFGPPDGGMRRRSCLNKISGWDDNTRRFFHDSPWEGELSLPEEHIITAGQCKVMFACLSETNENFPSGYSDLWHHFCDAAKSPYRPSHED